MLAGMSVSEFTTLDLIVKRHGWQRRGVDLPNPIADHAALWRTNRIKKPSS
jgi:hypothetical protein